MYARFWSYSQFFLKAHSPKGHGVHSPFAYSMIRYVTGQENDKIEIAKSIEKIRSKLLKNKASIWFDDYGTGNSGQRSIASIARKSVSSPRDAFLIHRLVKFVKPASVIELGTSLGITTLYLADAVQVPVHTIDACSATMKIAQEIFSSQSNYPIHTYNGRFEEQLPAILKIANGPIFCFVDGNHQREATLSYFYNLLQYVDENSCIAFHDIHLTKEMEEAWLVIINHPKVILSFDFFSIGIVFFNSSMLKKNYLIRY